MAHIYSSLRRDFSFRHFYAGANERARSQAQGETRADVSFHHAQALLLYDGQFLCAVRCAPAESEGDRALHYITSDIFTF